eukprot:3160169-Amphidinium_carterae.1
MTVVQASLPVVAKIGRWGSDSANLAKGQTKKLPKLKRFRGWRTTLRGAPRGYHFNRACVLAQSLL